ncbi:hypothetical protein BKA93DRAFT_774322 [Sparassis latifolia]
MSLNRSKKPYSRPASRPRGSEGEWLHDKAPGVSPAASNINATSTIPTSKLIISNLHYELTPKDLTQIFGQIGTLVREPLIRYDRSGRSSGVAIITFETSEDAAAAKQRFDGKLAKGQPMSIAFHAGAPHRPRQNRAASAPSSLLNRIQKPPLLDRLGGKGAKSQAPAPAIRTGPGPIRTKAARPPRVPKKPKTAAELDMEIDAFMKDDVAPTPAAPPPPPPTSAAAPVEEDVEMA